MRTYSTEFEQVRQTESNNYDEKEITFEVAWWDGIGHSYNTWKYNSFAEACTAWETLVERAKEIEKQYKEAQRIAAELEAAKEIPKEIRDFLDYLQAEIVPIKVGNGFVYEVRLMGFDDWKGSKQELIETFSETMNEWKKAGEYKC